MFCRVLSGNRGLFYSIKVTPETLLNKSLIIYAIEQGITQAIHIVAYFELINEYIPKKSTRQIYGCLGQS